MINLIKTISTCAITLLFATSFTANFEAGKHYRVVVEKKTSTPELTE